MRAINKIICFWFSNFIKNYCFTRYINRTISKWKIFFCIFCWIVFKVISPKPGASNPTVVMRRIPTTIDVLIECLLYILCLHIYKLFNYYIIFVYLNTLLYVYILFSTISLCPISLYTVFGAVFWLREIHNIIHESLNGFQRYLI